MTDLAIIGGGPAGYVAAERAGAKGLSVTLFEKNNCNPRLPLITFNYTPL